MKIYLSTSRVILRELDSDDHAALLELDSDEQVMKYLTDGVASTSEHITNVLDRIERMYEKYNHQFGVWAAIEKDSKKFMGWFLLKPCKKDQDNLEVVELGYRLKKQFWKKGYATEVSTLLLEKAFKELKAKEVFAKTMKENLNSLNVMKKIGLHFECDYIEDEFPGMDKRAVRYNKKIE